MRSTGSVCITSKPVPGFDPKEAELYSLLAKEDRARLGSVPSA